jgi:chromosome segregation ATPase
MGKSKLPELEQQVHDLEGDLSRVDAMLDAAERERRWGEVAALRAERDHIVAALDQARRALRAAEEQAAQEREAEARAARRDALLARDAALVERWDAWNNRFERVAEELDAIWREYRDIHSAHERLYQELRSAGLQSRFGGHMCKPAVQSRDFGDPVRWKG